MRLLPVGNRSSQAGISALLLIFIIIMVFIAALYGADLGYIKYTEQRNMPQAVTPTPGSSNTVVTAHGSITRKKYTVDIEMNIPLGGGAVTGTFSGSCDGNISGTFDGKDGGTISGTAAGSCTLILIPIPASGTFTGTVNIQQKTVSISGTGSAAGFKGDGSLTLTF